MKTLTLTTAILFISTMAFSQNRGSRNLNVAAQSNVNTNIAYSNGLSNVSNVNFNQSNLSNNIFANNVNDNTLNVSRNTNVIVNTRNNPAPTRTRPAPKAENDKEQRRNVVTNNNPITIQSRGNINQINYEPQNINVPAVNVLDNVEDNVIDTPIQMVSNEDFSNVNVVQEIVVQEKAVNVAPSLNLNVAVNIPKPNITYDLKVKEEKVVKEKVAHVKVSSGNGVTKVKSKTKAVKSKKHKSNHLYSQNVKIGTVLKNTFSKLRNKVKKNKTKKAVFSVVCCTF